MAYLIDIKAFTDKRGILTVIEKIIPFDVKRIFHIYGVDNSVSEVIHKTMLSLPISYFHIEGDIEQKQ